VGRCFRREHSGYVVRRPFLIARRIIVGPEQLAAAIEVSRPITADDWLTTLLVAAPAGFLIASIAWTLPNARGSEFWVILIVTYAIALGGFSHVSFLSGLERRKAAGGKLAGIEASLRFSSTASTLKLTVAFRRSRTRAAGMASRRSGFAARPPSPMRASRIRYTKTCWLHRVGRLWRQAARARSGLFGRPQA
jgi:hypothetical protein